MAGVVAQCPKPHLKKDSFSPSKCFLCLTCSELYIESGVRLKAEHRYTGAATMSDPRPTKGYRFGVFEADAATGELRRQGVRVRLNAQPFQVLCLLLERPGELLTREEIARDLWPDGTFVDYEHGVNSAVNRIREALGDSAANPRFVETLARRGYRFVAPVERIGNNASTGVAATDAREPAVKDGSEAGLWSSVLASPADLPQTSFSVVQKLFILFQLMYLSFYIGALANLPEIADLLSPAPHAGWIFDLLILTAAILIPVRSFLLCGAVFRAPRWPGKFLTIWPALLALDMLWSLSPFLLLHHINAGMALSCTALLVYAPFAQRSLVLMGAGDAARSTSASLS